MTVGAHFEELFYLLHSHFNVGHFRRENGSPCRIFSLRGQESKTLTLIKTFHTQFYLAPRGIGVNYVSITRNITLLRRFGPNPRNGNVTGVI